MRSTISRVGKYELKAVLARTAISTVYDGWDSDIARRVAIKLMPLSTAGDEEAREALARFKRGARAAGQLNHPNIVSVYDYGETEDYAYLVMEFIDGPTLKSLFDENRRFALNEIGFIVGGILNALQYSHDRRVVHRDMKPANVMFAQDGTVKITDFGIARIEDSEMTQAGMVIGTPAYMSPEQFLGEKIDWRTDIYSTGVLLYQILTGERPYEGTLATIMHKVLYGSPLLPSRLSTVATPALDQVVTRAMARRREDRFESAAEFNAALQSALAGTAANADRLAAKAPERRTPMAASPGPKVSRPAIFASVAAAAVVVGGGLAWTLFSGPKTVTEPAVSPVPAETAEPKPPSPPEYRAPAAPEPVVSPPEPVQPEPVEQPRVVAPPEPPAPVPPPPIRPIPDRRPAPVTKPPAPADHRPALPDSRNGKPPAEPNGPTAEDTTSEILRRFRNGVPGRTEPPAEAAPAPPLYATTSSSPVGLLCQTVTADSAESLGLDSPHGMVVIGVTAGSAADKAGIRQQDVILKIDGAEVRDLSVLRNVADRTVPVELFKHGNRRVVQLHVN
jgi:serine/threonine-protein kinase